MIALGYPLTSPPPIHHLNSAKKGYSKKIMNISQIWKDHKKTMLAVTASVAAAILLAIGTVALLSYLDERNISQDDTTKEPEKSITELVEDNIASESLKLAASIEKEADELAKSKPKEAEEKYREAEGLYHSADEETKAKEMRRKAEEMQSKAQEAIRKMMMEEEEANP